MFGLRRFSDFTESYAAAAPAADEDYAGRKPSMTNTRRPSISQRQPSLDRRSGTDALPILSVVDTGASASTSTIPPSALSGAGLPYAPKSLGCFVCETDDGLRINAGLVTGGGIVKKTGKPSVYISLTFASGLHTTVSSNGTVRIKSRISSRPVAPKSDGEGPTLGEAPVTSPNAIIDQWFANEKYRVVCSTAVSRTLGGNGPFAQDILYADGSRVLIRRVASNGVPVSLGLNLRQPTLTSMDRNSTRAIPKTAAGNDGAPPSTHSSRGTTNALFVTLLKSAPSTWKYLRLGVDGSVLFFSCEPGTIPEPTGTALPAKELLNILTVTKDCESASSVLEYRDGRLVVDFNDGLRKTFFPDGTLFTYYDSTKNLKRNKNAINNTDDFNKVQIMLVEKVGYPSVETDLAIDSISKDHASGKLVPISRGGDRVRMRVVAPDGTALIVKYDTRVTATYNGSIKMVRRDRTSLMAKDGGEFIFRPRTNWSDQVQ